VRYQRGGKTRDLLLVKPDAEELLFQTRLLMVPSGSPRPADRIIGWVVSRGRLCVVADCRLGKLPERTTDLLGVK